MGYVIAVLLVLLIVAALVLLLVRNATKKTNISDAGDPGADQNSLAILGSDDATPVGDTSQHANVAGEGAVGEKEKDSPEVARPVVGGEAEGERSAR